MKVIAKQFVYLFFLFFILVACTNNKEEEVEIIESFQIDAFWFSAEKNTALFEDKTLEMQEGKLKGQLSKYFPKKLIAEFKTNAKSVLVNGVSQVSGVTENDFSEEVLYTFIGEKGTKKEVVVNINWMKSEVPEIIISVENNAEIVTKDTYLNAQITVKGGDRYPSYTGTTEIRGRGNSTWSYPKKPYRLRLTTKSEILGLPSARNWVLLANYLDPSLMCNSVAMRIGKDLNLPFTNTIIPVDLTINGQYRGSYVLTEQIEVDENRVNVAKDGFLLEIDTHYDEDFQFKSTNYDLPVMIKNPKLQNQSEIDPIKIDFEQMESLVFSSDFPDNGYRDKLDIDVFARYLIVYFLTGNQEINHPKSVYIHKVSGGKYTFGPIWDFDWAYGYGPRHFENVTREFLVRGPGVLSGSKFINRLVSDPKVKEALRNHWAQYRTLHFDNLLVYLDEYADFIRPSFEKNASKWVSQTTIDEQTARFKNYLVNRANFLDGYINGL